jgi:alpha-L-fucosidase
MQVLSQEDRVKWFNEARFGVFFHWGVSSIRARGEWALYSERTPWDEYLGLASRFHPKPGWAEEWMETVRSSGAKYAVMTTKHHDGYCLFDTASSDFSSAKTGPRTDLVAEYVNACRKAGVPVGLYYSPPDWRFGWDMAAPLNPDYERHAEYVEYIRTQVHELCTNYGPIDLWWWDGVPPNVEETVAWMREAQPNMIINDRCGLKLDCATAEKEIRPPSEPAPAWEVCTTSNMHWGYFGGGDRRWMSTRDVIHWMTAVASLGGNFLLNIGPKADGSIPAKARRLFTGVGDWLAANGESVYGTGPSSVTGGSVGAVTAKGDTAYLHIMHYYAPQVVILSPEVRVESAKVLATGQSLGVRQTGERVIISGLPRKAPDTSDTVVVLKTSK